MNILIKCLIVLFLTEETFAAPAHVDSALEDRNVSGNLADCVNDCSCKNYNCSSVETAYCNKIDKGIVDWKCDCKPCDVTSNDIDHNEESDETEDVINNYRTRLNDEPLVPCNNDCSCRQFQCSDDEIAFCRKGNTNPEHWRCSCRLCDDGHYGDHGEIEDEDVDRSDHDDHGDDDDSFEDPYEDEL